MPAQPGHLMILERFSGSTWTQVVDVRNLELSITNSTTDVTTHRHVDANGLLHMRNIKGPFSYTLTGEGIAHAQSLEWIRKQASGENEDDLLRIVIPNLAAYYRDYMIFSDLTITGQNEGAVTVSFTLVPSAETTPGQTPAWTD